MARDQCAVRASARRGGRYFGTRGEAASAHDLHRLSPGELLLRSQPPGRDARQISEPLFRYRGAPRRAFAHSAVRLAILQAVPGSAPLWHGHESAAGDVSRHVPAARNRRRTFLSRLFLEVSLAHARLGPTRESPEKDLSRQRVETFVEAAPLRLQEVTAEEVQRRREFAFAAQPARQNAATIATRRQAM